MDMAFQLLALGSNTPPVAVTVGCPLTSPPHTSIVAPVHTAVCRSRGEGAALVLVGVQGEVHAGTTGPGAHRPMPSQAPGPWQRSPPPQATPGSARLVVQTPALQRS